MIDEARFMYMAELLKIFIKENKRVPKQLEVYRGEKIGAWLSNQKHLYKVRRLKAKKKDIMENIDLWVYTYINS